VLTRQPQAIEALGTTSVLCVDKTGTLTCNRMEVVALHDGEHALRRAPGDSLPAAFDRLLRGAALASVREGLEPMDQAIFRLPSPAAADGLQPLRREAVLPGRPFVRRCWRKQGEAEVLFALKGAPEAVLARCLQAPQQQQTVHAQTQAWAARGLRVIAVASARGVDEAAPPESGYELLGLLGFQDPVRDDVPAALQACRDAGVRVVMITGDAAATALAIARNAGLVRDEGPAAVLAGAQLDAMNEAEFEQAVVGVSVFARVTPAQKLRIVQALQRRGEVVAMTGDGVNDGPALRAADIGVAMGQRGTDVAREAAALVLLDDRFASLVDAVRAGRRIFANLQKAMGYLFAAHVPIVGLSLLPLFGGPVLLLPIHVVLLELIIDPACSLVFEAEPLAADGMRVPPRRSNSPLFSLDAIARALAVGVMALLAVVIVQWLGHRAVLSDPALRLAGLSTIVVGNLVMLQWFRGGLRRSRPTNRVFVGLLLGVSLLSVVLLLTPPMSAALGFPAGLDARWVLAALCLPAAWALWRLVSPARRNPS
jgi:Ca2+-transporting ATPase